MMKLSQIVTFDKIPGTVFSMFTGAASVPEELATSRRSRCSSCAASCSTTSEPAHRSRRTSRRGRRPRASWLCPPSSSRRGDPFPSCFRCRASTCCSRLLGPSSVGGDVRQPSRANGLLVERYGCGTSDLLRGRNPNSWGPDCRTVARARRRSFAPHPLCGQNRSPAQ